MNRLVVLAVAALAAVPAAAVAAASPGRYSGTSSAKYIQVGSATEPTDRGRLTFTLRGSRVLDFRLRGQQMNCGPGPVVDVTVRSIRLNNSGRGIATYRDPNIGTLRVSIRVTSTGRASGTVRRPASATGLCDPDYPVRFTARARSR